MVNIKLHLYFPGSGWVVIIKLEAKLALDSELKLSLAKILCFESGFLVSLLAATRLVTSCHASSHRVIYSNVVP